MSATSFLTPYKEGRKTKSIIVNDFGMSVIASDFINDDQINAIANLVAVVATLIGIVLNHSKKPTVPQDKINNIKY